MIDKALNIIGITDFVTIPPPGTPPFPAEIKGVLEVANIPAGKRVLISNINPLPDPGYTMPWGLRIQNCAGEVVIDGLYTGSDRAGHVLEITNCSNVTINNSTINFGPSPLVITNSMVRISWSAITCYFPPQQVGGYPDTQPAIDVTDSTLTVTGGSLIRGAREMQTSYGSWTAKPGIVHDNSVLNIGPGVSLTGGAYLSGGVAWGCLPKVPGALSSVIRRDLRAGVSGAYPAATIVDMPTTYTQPAVANQDMGVVIAGPPDGFAMLLLSDLPHAPTPTPFGPALLDPLATAIVDLHFLPASTNGFASKYYFVPSAALNGHAYVMQSLTLSPAGQIGFTAPTPFLVGWEHGRIP